MLVAESLLWHGAVACRLSIRGNQQSDASTSLQRDRTVKICDLTQFYSPLSGGVKRYLHEKIAYIRQPLAGGRTCSCRARLKNRGDNQCAGRESIRFARR